ncbi:hypothetical protein FRC14_006236 [Serendipita sp. 396]|nr:hypothetical protein FRC14_006236 [Serendipita sp. 396]KAG8789599.1 hypothetical protein FRC15_006331 [Serendipita sp. 397]KAG8878077.1 hypothetical protein FRC20_009362 [Serendipita sp. 405]
MDPLQQAIAFSGPAFYFLFIFLGFYVVLSDIIPSASFRKSSPVAKVYGCLAFASFLHTFAWIILDLKWSYENFYNSVNYTVVGSQVDRIAHWLDRTALFKEAWMHGYDGIFNHWWLENLCIFAAGAWSVFLVSEGRRKQIPHLWAYMIIAELVAVSTASCLFYLALSLQAIKLNPIPHKKNDDDINAVLPPEDDATAPLMLTIPVLLALFTISIRPDPSSPDFLLNIIVLHVLCLVPTLPAPLWTTRPSALNVPVLTVYFAITAMAFVLRLQSTMAAVSSLDTVGIVEFVQEAANAMHSHPAMATFAWDTIWTTAAWCIWNVIGDGTEGPNLQSLIPLLSFSAGFGVSMSAPMTLGNVIEELTSKEETKFQGQPVDN